MSETKKLVVYYSLEGNTRLIAETIAQTLGADLLELQLKKEINPKGLLKFFWGGKQVVMKEKPELLAWDKNPQEYDLLFIGTPVWAGSYAGPFNTFFADTKLKNKKIALFCCYAGQAGKTLENLKSALVGNDILGEIEFRDPLKRGKESAIKRVLEWAKKIASNTNG